VLLVCPLLAPWYRLVEDGDRLLLEHGRSAVVLEGGAVRALLPRLLPLLDGTRTVAQIVAAVGEPAAAAVEAALDLLEANGLLVEGPPPTSAETGTLAIAAAYGLDPALVLDRIRVTTVGVVGSASAGEHTARLLRADGLRFVQELGWHEGGVDLAVVAPSAEEVPRLTDWNHHALEQGIRWLAIRPFDGAIYAVGPLVIPGESCCHECTELRLAAHLQYGRRLALVHGVPPAAIPTAGLAAAAAGLAAHLTLCWLAGADTRLPGELYVLAACPELTLSSHPVLRVPRCPACSDVERLAAPLPWHEAEAA
jgi:bacteriocin biosynthesis cyclodehydratase domain-containing protein